MDRNAWTFDLLCCEYIVLIFSTVFFLEINLMNPLSTDTVYTTNQVKLKPYAYIMGLLPDTKNYWLRMRQECRECFPPNSHETES